MTQWDFQNKGTLTSPARLSFVLKVPLRHLRSSVIYSVPCDWILQMVYCGAASVGSITRLFDFIGWVDNVNCPWKRIGSYRAILPNEGLKLKTSAFESLYGGQFTLSTQLIKPYYFLVILMDAPPCEQIRFRSCKKLGETLPGS